MAQKFLSVARATFYSYENSVKLLVDNYGMFTQTVLRKAGLLHILLSDHRREVQICETKIG